MIALATWGYLAMTAVTFVGLLWFHATLPMMGPIGVLDVVKYAAMAPVWFVLPLPSWIEELGP